jgi:hypothetical protein
MGFVIELKHRKSGDSKFVGSVPVKTGTDKDARESQSKGYTVVDNENTFFETIEEARKFPFETAELAALMVHTFPKTKNIDSEVVEVK